MVIRALHELLRTGPLNAGTRGCGCSMLTDCAAHSDEHSRSQPQEQVMHQCLAFTPSPDPPATEATALPRYAIRHTFPTDCGSTASGAARRPLATVPMKVRRSNGPSPCGRFI